MSRITEIVGGIEQSAVRQMSPRLYADLIGKPFEWGGRGPDKFDCYGIVKFILGRNGVEIPDYPSNKTGILNALLILSEMRRFKKCDPMPGAIAVFRMDQSGPSHVGLVVERDRFVHIMENIHVSIERLSSPLWKRRTMEFRQWPV